jgi:hypothetical protein
VIRRVWSGRGRRHLLSATVAAAVVGVAVALVARSVAGSSCPEYDALRVVSSCRDLVGSLAVRVGAAAGVAVLLMDLLSAGLRRTAEIMEEHRRTAAIERSPERISG